ncbi:hypothetical protein YC2023_069009 [Brassica napus]
MGEARRERVRLSKTFRLEKVLVNLSMIEMASSSGLRFPRFHSGNNLCHSQKILQKNTVNAMKQSDATYKEMEIDHKSNKFSYRVTVVFFRDSVIIYHACMSLVK